MSFNNKVESALEGDKTDGARDSDDDDVEASHTPAHGLVTITGNDDSKEVISNHVTKSAVKLASDSLIYELDDDI